MGKKFEIILDKKIPVGAGNLWRFSRCSSYLIKIRKLFNKDKKIIIKYQFLKLFQIGSELGSDVPSCIISKDLRLSGYGKK